MASRSAAAGTSVLMGSQARGEIAVSSLPRIAAVITAMLCKVLL